MEWVEPNSSRWLALEDLPNEKWLDINEYEGLYQVSNYGRIKSMYTNKVLKCAFDKRGYTRVTLVKNKTLRYYRINRLVAKAFIPNPNGEQNVLHIKPVDIGYCNNNVDNLYWGSIQDNNRTTVKQRRGNGYVVLQYNLTGDFVKSFDSCREAGRSLNITHEYIAECCRGIRKDYNGYIWKYEKDVKNELAL